MTFKSQHSKEKETGLLSGLGLGASTDFQSSTEMTKVKVRGK